MLKAPDSEARNCAGAAQRLLGRSELESEDRLLIWHHNPDFDRQSVNRIGNRALWWIYGALFLGLLARVFGIKPSKITALGVELSVSNADVIPGLFFIIVIFLTFLIFLYIICFGIFYDFNNKSLFRLFLYRSAITKKKFGRKSISYYTFRGKNIRAIKMMARTFNFIYSISMLTIVLFPAIFVLLFERTSLWAAMLKITQGAA